ncbi:hypothetical protein D3C80_1627230 [compost metagenome]
MFHNVATDAANQVQTIGFACTGQDLRHLHRLFAHPEELHKTGVETDEMAGQPQIQQMAVQAFHFQQH